MTTTQCERLLAYLQKHGRINPIEAWQHLGIYRLGARVFDLKQGGHNITKQTIEVPNQFGEACRVAEYRMQKGGAA